MEKHDAKKVPTGKVVVWLIKVIFVLGITLFGSAGTFNWPEAWILIAVYLAFATVAFSWMQKNDPDLLRKRMNVTREARKGWDKLVMAIGTPVFLAMMALPGLDVVRFGWSKLPIQHEIAGFFATIPSFILFFLVLRENAWLSRVVEIQKGQKVITTGPYAVIRHPMYAAIIVFYLSWPLMLGSLYGLIPAVILIILILFRTALEDRTLHKELPGYPDYAKKVRFRLIPGIW